MSLSVSNVGINYFQPVDTISRKDSFFKITSLVQQYLESSNHRLLEKAFHEDIPNGEQELVKRVCIKENSNILVKGLMPFSRASVCKTPNAVKFLLQNHADSSLENHPSSQEKENTDRRNGDQEELSFSRACKTGDIALASLLLEHNASIDELDLWNQTPLCNAILLENEKVALFLIKKGASINRCNVYGIPLLNLAITRGLLRIVDELICKGVNVRGKNIKDEISIHIAASGKNAKILISLLKSEARLFLNVKDDYGVTPLYNAAINGCLNNVKILVKAGADLSIKYEGLNILEVVKKNLETLPVPRGSSDFAKKDRQEIRSKKAIKVFLEKAMDPVKREKLLKKSTSSGPAHKRQKRGTAEENSFLK